MAGASFAGAAVAVAPPRACLLTVWWLAGQACRVSRYQVFSDEQWQRIRPLLPSNEGKVGRPYSDHRTVVEAIVYRYRTGIPWRDLPREVFGPWQTVWKRHRRFSRDGTWDKILAQLTAQADADGEVDWVVSVDATINRAHQHATNTTRPQDHTGGQVERHVSTPRRCPQ